MVFVNERPHSYMQGLQHRLEELVRLSRMLSPADGTERGTAFVLRADQVQEEEMTLLLAAARVVLHPRQGSLLEQVTRLTVVRVAEAPPAPQVITDNADPEGSR